MKRTMLLLGGLAPLLGSPLAAQGAPTDTATAAAVIRAQIDKYLTSIDRADTALGAQVFSTTPDVIFIHPRGTERGWAQVAHDVYGTLMGVPFTKRRLRPVGNVVVQVRGEAAVVEFQWDFVATFRKAPPGMGPTLHTEGRETDVLANIPGKGWRIVHVHYSGMPVSGAGRGF